MRQIYQLVHTLNYGDAISGETLAIKSLLNKMGIRNEIYSLHAHEKVIQHRKPWTALREDYNKALGTGEEVIAILHYSIASLFDEVFMDLSRALRVVIYHNLTPPRWFHNYNARVERDLIAAQEKLGNLLAQADVLLADSEFNRQELLSVQDREVEVLPLLLDLDKWQVEANAGIARAIKSSAGKNILHVGRIAPNKCIEDIIKAFYFYHHKIEPNSRLWLVGIDIDTEIYSLELRRLVAKLQLKEVVNFVGSVADSELRAFYENCDLYLCMSEHEGFCLPLLESMYFGLPVIAFDSCAIGATLEDGGILLERKDPAAVAELMNILLTDSQLRAKVIEGGKGRAKDFLPDKFAAHFERVLLQAIFGSESEYAKKRSL
ncbi:MAG: glycosyltransferase family 4 protein [Deltaproteobacteria bacterium]|nr:glycosyltransferase family 4 protein [Deltaproteobacteria bacterium]